MMIKSINSIQELEQFAAELVKEFFSSTIILASGDLGTGKTALAKQIAKHLGLNPNNIKSPTYALHLYYQLSTKNTNSLLSEPKFSPTSFHHLDLYRLKEIDLSTANLLTELCEEKNTIIYIEWPEKVAEFIKEKSNLQIIEINLKIEETNTRTITINKSRTASTN